MYKSNCIHSSECESRKESFEEMIVSEAGRVKPIIKEQLLRKYIFGADDAYDLFDIYCKMFSVDSMLETRMIIIRSVLRKEEDIFILKNMSEKLIGADNILLCVVIGDYILVITELLERGLITDRLEKLSRAVRQRYGCDIMAVYSKTACLSESPEVYKRLKRCIGYSFYSGINEILYENEINLNISAVNYEPDYESVEKAVTCGDADELKMLLKGFFDVLREIAPETDVARTYCLKLYIFIIRGCAADRIEQYINGIGCIQSAKTLEEIHSFIEEKGVEIASANIPAPSTIYSSLIRDTIKIIDDNLENENLSLRWLAGTILYTNVDYLGKLFKKETGKNFSHYVMEKRMEMAKALIIDGKKDRIYEVAEKVGYGSNSQYFSQVFKKYTGVSPLEYKEFARLSREKNSERSRKITQT